MNSKIRRYPARAGAMFPTVRTMAAFALPALLLASGCKIKSAADETPPVAPIATEDMPAATANAEGVAEGRVRPKETAEDEGRPLAAAEGETEKGGAAIDRPRQAVFVELQPRSGSNVQGSIRLEPEGARVHVYGEIRGLSPGPHGFHIHEKGDCTASDAKSAGGHFAPHGSPHGAPTDPPDKRHAGDFGNIVANQDGVAKVDMYISLPVLEAGVAEAVLGRAMIVHAGKDDLSSQPSGDAGDRVACGVIRRAPGT